MNQFNESTRVLALVSIWKRFQVGGSECWHNSTVRRDGMCKCRHCGKDLYAINVSTPWQEKAQSN